MSSMLSHLLDDMSVDTSYTVERFIKEAAQGRVEAVKKMLPKMKDRVCSICITFFCFKTNMIMIILRR